MNRKFDIELTIEKLSYQGHSTLFLQFLFVDSLHLVHLTVFVVERQSGLNLPFQLVLTQKHRSFVNYEGVSDSEL